MCRSWMCLLWVMSIAVNLFAANESLELSDFLSSSKAGMSESGTLRIASKAGTAKLAAQKAFFVSEKITPGVKKWSKITWEFNNVGAVRCFTSDDGACHWTPVKNGQNISNIVKKQSIYVRFVLVADSYTQSPVVKGIKIAYDSDPLLFKAKKAALMVLKYGYNKGRPETKAFHAASDRKYYEEHLKKMGFNEGYANFSPRLTMNYLKQFNVVVYTGPDGFGGKNGSNKTKLIKAKQQLLLDYVKAGGGLLVFRSPGWQFGTDIADTNAFLKPIGAKILHEQIRDTENKIKMPFGKGLFGTNNIINHLVTKGVRGLFYPDTITKNYGRYTDFSSPLKVDKNWTVLISGSKTAKSFATKKSFKLSPESPGTYQSAPPFLAVRNYEKGRIAVFPLPSSCFWQDAYHFIWRSGLIMKGQADGMRSDGAKLMDNLITYLAQPSRGKFGGYVPPKGKKKYEPGLCSINWNKPQYNVFPSYPPKFYKGLIGARSSLSSGKGSPEDFIKAAKAAGYDFIAFTGDITKLSPEKFKQLKTICKKNSDNNFKAYPGFAYLDESGNRWVTFAPWLVWPQKNWWSKKFPGRLIVNNLVSRGYNWPPVIMVASNKNPEPFFCQGNFKLISTYTYENGKLIDDSLATYMRLSRNMFKLGSVALHFVDSPIAVTAASKKGYQACVRWFDNDVVAAFKGNYCKYKTNYIYFRPVFVSEGPVFLSAAIKNFGVSDLAISGSERFRFNIQAKSDVGLKEVTIYDGGNPVPWRRFLLNGAKKLNKTIDAYHDKVHSFIIVLTDVNGKKAVSWECWTGVQENDYPRCSDNLNTMSRGKWWYPSEKMQHPRGFEAYPAGRNFTYFGFPKFARINESQRPAVEYYSIVTSRFGTIVDAIQNYHYPVNSTRNSDVTDQPQLATANKLFKGKTRYTFYTPWNDGSMIELTEGDYNIIKDFNSSQLNVFYQGRKCDGIYASSGKKVLFKGVLSSKRGFVEYNLPLYALAAVYSDPLKGSIGAIAMQEGLRCRLAGRENYGVLALGYINKSGKYRKNDKISYKYLGIISKLLPKNDSSFVTNIYNTMGLSGKPAYRISPANGSVLSSDYILKLHGKDYAFSAKITQAKLPIQLPVEVAGLNPNWDAAIWYKGKNTFIVPEYEINAIGQRYVLRKQRTGTDKVQRFPVLKNGIGMLQIDTAIGAKDIFIGNLLRADNVEVKLILLDVRPGKVKFEIHNPTSRDIKCTVKPGKGFKLIKDFSSDVSLKAGSSKIVNIK